MSAVQIKGLQFPVMLMIFFTPSCTLYLQLYSLYWKEPIKDVVVRFIVNL